MRKYLDYTGITLSGVCFIHCILTPILIMLTPFISLGIFASHEFHESIIYFIVPTAIVALAIGCNRHRDMGVALVGIIGITILILALWAHDHWAESVNIVITMVGSLTIIAAHYRNRLLCQKEEYECHKQD